MRSDHPRNSFQLSAAKQCTASSFNSASAHKQVCSKQPLVADELMLVCSLCLSIRSSAYLKSPRKSGPLGRLFASVLPFVTSTGCGRTARCGGNALHDFVRVPQALFSPGAIRCVQIK